MKTKIVVMRPGEPQQESEVELGDPPSIDELHAVLDPLLGTRHFEHVRVYAGEVPRLGVSAYRDMFVDEEGAILGRARNEAATVLYRRNWLMHEGVGAAEDIAAIYGPAVYFPDRVVWS
jgi:hypothetical protein